MENGKWDWKECYDIHIMDRDISWLKNAVDRAFTGEMFPEEVALRLSEIADIVLPNNYRKMFQTKAEQRFGSQPNGVHYLQVLKESPLHRPYQLNPLEAELRRMGNYNIAVFSAKNNEDLDQKSIPGNYHI